MRLAIVAMVLLLSIFSAALSHDFFNDEQWERFPKWFQERWAQPPDDKIWVNKWKPMPKELRKKFLWSLMHWIKAKWLPTDLGNRIVYMEYTKGLEGLYRNYFFVQYEIGEYKFQLKGFYGYTAALIKPLESNAPLWTNLQKALERQDASEVREIMIRMWNEFTKMPLVRDSNSHFLKWQDGYIQLKGIVAVHSSQRDEVSFSIWTDGCVVELVLNEPESVWSYENPLIKRLLPLPTISPIKPLNSNLVIFEESHLYWTKEHRPINQSENAHHTVIAIIFKDYVEGNSQQRRYWVKLPLTSVKWHLCEYGALLTRYLNPIRRRLLYSHIYERDLSSIRLHRTALIRMHVAYREFAKLSEKIKGIKYLPQIEGVHLKVMQILRQADEAWQFAICFWEQALQDKRPTDEYIVRKGREINKELQKRKCSRRQLVSQLREVMEAFYKLWEKHGIGEADLTSSWRLQEGSH